MSLTICVLDPSRPQGEVVEWGFGTDIALVSGRLGGPTLVDRLRPTLGPRTHVVLLHRPSERRDGAFLANVVSGAMPDVPVTRLEVTSSLLAATVIGLEVANISDEGEPTRLSRIERTLTSSVNGVWLSRVTRLATPSPTFGQHLRSVVPGGRRFVALCGPRGRVERAVPDGHTREGASQLVIGAPEDHAGARQLAAWFGAGDVVHVPPVLADVRRAYGNPGVEFTVVGEVIALPGASSGRCRVCRDVVHGPACPYCHVRPDVPETSRA